jgi:GUN4-like
MPNTSDRSHQQQASNTRNSSSSNSYLPIEELTDVVNYDPTTNTLNLDLFSLLAPETAEITIPPSPDLPAPKLTDAVLGDRTPSPVNSLVLGGIDGVRRKLQQSGQSNEYYRVAAIDALTYRAVGLDLLTEIVLNKTGYLQCIAYELLFESTHLKLRANLIPLFPLQSSAGIDYSQLRDLLFAGKWADVNKLTTAKILEAVGHPGRKYVELDDLPKLPALDLHTIDRLWLKASDRRFGFSVQKQIYLEENGNFEYRGVSEFGTEFGKFCQRIGWDAAGWYGTGGDNRFSLQAPIGFMPSIAAETRGGAYYTIALLSHSGLSTEDVFA